MRRLTDAGALLIEVLPEREYTEEHIPGALNIPLKKLTPDSVSTFASDQPLSSIAGTTSETSARGPRRGSKP